MLSRLLVLTRLSESLLCCSVVQRVASFYSVLQRVAACCSVLQRVAACCSVLQRVAACCSVLQHVAACCSGLQRVAACCSVLQRVAACCNTYSSMTRVLIFSIGISVSTFYCLLPTLSLRSVGVCVRFPCVRVCVFRETH